MRRAFAGKIESAGRVLNDPDHTIERFLLVSMPAELASVQEQVTRMLG
jgi:hypothetical protein